MGSRAQDFEEGGVLKVFVDDGRDYYVIQFKDDSGLVLQKKQSEDRKSTAEFIVRDDSVMDSLRMISSRDDFEVDKSSNTQQNLCDLLMED